MIIKGTTYAYNKANTDKCVLNYKSVHRQEFDDKLFELIDAKLFKHNSPISYFPCVKVCIFLLTHILLCTKIC